MQKDWGCRLPEVRTCTWQSGNYLNSVWMCQNIWAFGSFKINFGKSEFRSKYVAAKDIKKWRVSAYSGLGHDVFIEHASGYIDLIILIENPWKENKSRIRSSSKRVWSKNEANSHDLPKNPSRIPTSAAHNFSYKNCAVLALFFLSLSSVVILHLQ